MEYLEIAQLLQTAPVRLLQSPNAAMILGFLHRAFKASFRPTIPEGEIRSILENYLCELNEIAPGMYPDTAADYLATWRDPQHGFLRRSYEEGHDEPIFELTSGAEKVLLWMESLRRVEFVGTESRLASIFAGLDEIVRFASGDVDERITLLNADARRIQDEIDRIRSSGKVEQYSAVKLNERFARLITTARELLSDFRAVEENFQHIAQDIAEAHVRPGATKGFVLEQMLDAHDALKDSPQGQSFFGFRELLLAPDKQEHFEKTIERTGSLAIINSELRSNPLLTQLMTRLLVEDETVLASTQRVSSNLRRVLDTSDLSERRRIATLIKDISALALRVKDTVDYKASLFELADIPDVFVGMSRPLWREQPAMVPLENVEIEDDDSALEELRRFRNLPQVRLSELRKNVDACLDKEDNVILASVLAAFPPKNGIIDVIGYLIIAGQEERHYLGDDDNTRIELPSGECWNVPAILFTRGLSA